MLIRMLEIIPVLDSVFDILHQPLELSSILLVPAGRKRDYTLCVVRVKVVVVIASSSSTIVSVTIAVVLIVSS